jgi:hypothetical protein
MVWYVGGRDVSQPQRIASQAPSAAFSAPPIEKPKIKGDSRSGLGGSGHASRDAHLRRDEAAPKMGHPALVAREVKPLPKLDVFPTPAILAGPVRELAETSRRRKIVMGLTESSVKHRDTGVKIEPITIAKIDITPL